MNTTASHLTPGPIPRRRFVAGCSAFAAAAASAAGSAPLPAGGMFAAGSARLRVGVIGCGGRGTGAAIQAAAADPAVAITCLGDLFADQVASSADMLEALAGRQFACPPNRRFVGPDAWRHVLAADVDLIILAGPPASRPRHVAAAVAAGRHLFCETPAAIDPEGVRVVQEAAAEAERRGLSIVSGLQWRHDPVTRMAVTMLRDGELGRISQVETRSFIGLPWRKPLHSDWSAEECRLRNWISYTPLSGGHLVEHHVHAIDRAVAILGSDLPARAVPISPRSGAAGAVNACAPTTAVRFEYADGRSIEAVIDRRPRGRSRVEELVRGTGGSFTLPPTGRRKLGQHPCQDPCQAAMNSLVAAVLSGSRADDSAPLCAASLVAILGRMAVDSAGPIRMADVQPSGLASLQPVQSTRS